MSKVEQQLGERDERLDRRQAMWCRISRLKDKQNTTGYPVVQ